VTVPELGGLATRFRYADVDFFLLDTRSHRADRPTGSAPTRILGEAQIDWLRRELVRSEATFRVVAAGAPILNPADSEENLSFASEEHTRLLQMLRDERIPGLVFLSGGKYYGELTRLVHANSYNLYDLTLGPLTAKPESNEDELNFFRMPGTSTFERHFALIDVSGPEEARELTFRVLSLEGEQLWTRTVTASELQPPASD
jgi:Phosphodiesterase/alkaline phosphatase D